MNKLVMIITDTHRLPYGTILSVVREHKNHKGYIATPAESSSHVYVAKTIVKEV
jgi:hypothetical protein